MSFFSKIFNRTNTKDIKPFIAKVAEINALESSISALTDEELKSKTLEFKEKIKNATLGLSDKKQIQERREKILNEILPEAFALVREASKRTLKQRHFDVQLVGGMVLHSGSISEMRTGEGKTLVATLPAYLNALSGEGVHIVTVNDYLSRRDAVWMGQIYYALGLSVGVINHESSFIYDPSHKPEKLDEERDVEGSFHVVHEFLRPVTRREAYMADITYGTNNEFGFDFLRDNLEYSPAQLRQREPNYAIVDEIDSILIDEARTPLIISAPTHDAESIYKQFASIVSPFAEGIDYTKDEKRRSINILPAGIEKAEKALNVENLYTDKGIKYVHHLETAIRAKALFHKDQEYVVRDNEIMIVDEFTGRIQPGRRWSEGLHQAIEAKEGVKIQQESRTYASITFQNFFRMYQKLSGMTGTALTSAEEFFKVYGLEVAVVPTNKQTVRIDRNDQIFKTEVGKFKAIAKEIKKVHATGQPILIGTVSIERNELLSQFLKAEGVRHEVLNAKNHEREGEIIAQAGRKGAVTIATNMAGRGVDIKLGGSPNTPETYEEVKSLGGLFVMGTERHEARRIDNQLRGRSGRQGDSGTTQFFVSLEDTLMRVFASDIIKSLMGRLGVAEDEPIQHKMISNALETAQEKIEGFNFDARKHVLEFDDVINTQRSSIYTNRRKILTGSIADIREALEKLIKTQTNKFNNNILGISETQIPAEPEIDIQSIVDNKVKEFGENNFWNAVRILLLQTIDMFWVEHLEVMDYTRSSVNLRAFGQRDPLIEYKKEGLRLYKEMQNAMKEQILRILPNIIPTVGGVATSSDVELKTNEEANVSTKDVSKSGDEIGRNDPCPCGSGRKYKKCHGASV
jgi:preprotein translocase subunit SecA